MVSHVECIDNIKFMKKFPDKFFDLAMPDPPYGIGEAGKNHKSRNRLVRQKDGLRMRRCASTDYEKKDWDNQPPSDEYFDLLFSVAINHIVFGANYFTQIVGTSFKPPRRVEYESFLRKYPNGWIVWDKVNGGNDFNDCELIWTSFDFESYVLPFMWAGMMQGKSISEGAIMQGDKTKNEKRIHPTQKPILIYKYLLFKFSAHNQKVIDTNMGSQSSRIAAHEMGVDYWGCENDHGIFTKGEKRYNQHISQLSIF